jgi:Domain of unknown function (DUF4124)
MKRRIPRGVTTVGRRCAGLALTLFAIAAGGQGSVIKCIDADGNITYQDVPCTAGQAGRAIDLPKAETREDTSAWEAAARDARVVNGMPKRWVLRARGAPIEIRPASAREEATEVWRYVVKDGSMLVGFAGSNVAWVRNEAAVRAAAPAATGGSVATRGAQNRRFVIPGRFCEHVFAEIGAADREELLDSPPPTAGAATPAPADRRYFYEPQAGDPQMRTVFSCVGGKVADVERTVVR